MTIMGRRTAAMMGVMFAFVPLLLFAYLGLHSRLMLDDYLYFGLARDIGTWKAMLLWREFWNGGYSNFLLYGLLAPLGASAPPLFSLFVCASAFVGFGWLTNTLLAYLEIRAHRRAIAVGLASLTTAATINGFHHAQVFYWLTAAVVYNWPAVMLLLGIAMAAAAAHRLRGRIQLLLSAIAAALYAFSSAGFSEMHLVFQIVALALIAIYVFNFLRGPRRRSYRILAAAACLGTFVSLLAQVTAPGFANRFSQTVVFGTPIFPVRHLPDLLDRALDATLEYMSHEASFTGFMLVAFASLFVILTVGTRYPEDSIAPSKHGAAAPIAFALITQVFFVPVLWTHSSDNVQVIGRFSYAFALVVCLNLIAITVLLALLWRRDLLDKTFKRHNGLMIYCFCVLLLVCLFFAMTQVRSVHYKPSSYLFFTVLSTLIMLAGQLTCMADDRRIRGLFPLSAFATAGAVITLAALIGVKLWGAGYIVERALAAATYALMLAGLIVGVTLGALIRLGFDMTNANAVWLRWIRLFSLIVALTIAAGMVIEQGQRISYARMNAEIWDANHVEIIRLRDDGDPTVYTERFPSLIHRSLDAIPYRYKNDPLTWEPMLYYGLLDDGEAFHNCSCSNEMVALGEESPSCAQVICLAYGERGD